MTSRGVPGSTSSSLRVPVKLPSCSAWCWIRWGCIRDSAPSPCTRAASAPCSRASRPASCTSPSELSSPSLATRILRNACPLHDGLSRETRRGAAKLSSAAAVTLSRNIAPSQVAVAGAPNTSSACSAERRVMSSDRRSFRVDLDARAHPDGRCGSFCARDDLARLRRHDRGATPLRLMTVGGAQEQREMAARADERAGVLDRADALISAVDGTERVGKRATGSARSALERDIGVAHRRRPPEPARLACARPGLRDPHTASSSASAVSMPAESTSMSGALS